MEPRDRSRVPLVAGAATTLNYAAWLAWDQRMYVAGGREQGPYRPWQVAGLVLVLGAIAVYAGRRRRPQGGAAAGRPSSPRAGSPTR